MATGKIKWFNNDKGYGFIKNDAGGDDVFLHRSEVSPDDIESLSEGKAVVFNIQKTAKGLNAHNFRLQAPPFSAPESTESKPSSEVKHTHFHNPYTFVPSPPRQDAISAGGFAGDFDPLEHDLSHESLKPDLWTGHLPIKLTTVTPLVLPKTDGEERLSTDHQIYDVLNYLPEPSLRGMLRSAYEVVTNSRYGCFRNDDQLAYRMETEEALKLIPAVIENGNGAGELVARLYTGTSHATAQRPNGHGEKGAMYAAMLTRYKKSALRSICAGGYTPCTGDKVWAEIVLCQHEVSPRYKTDWRKDYKFWKVIKVWPKCKHPNKPEPTNQQVWPLDKPQADNNNQSYYSPLNPEQRKVVEGRVLITNENMGNKHDERIFFNPQSEIFSVNHLEDPWRMRIKSYREAHSDDEIFERKGAKKKPWKYIGNKPGKTAWSPHLYQDGKHRDQWGRNAHDAMKLQPGDMVYARCKFNTEGDIKIEDLFPVMISRELYAESPDDLLDSLLKPANERSELSPADRLFGWVPQKSGSDQGYKGRIRVICEDGVRPEIIEKFNGGTLPLAILGQPKPAQGRFYVAKDAQGNPQDDGIRKQQAGYSKGKGLRGRKQYWHHKGLEADKAQDYWKPSVKDRTQQQSNGRYQEYRRPDKDEAPDSQNRSITGWIKPGTVFKASLYVQNLQSEEIGALLWLLSLPEDHYFRLGYGKPLGFGSVRMEVDEQRCVHGYLPLGTDKDWKDYYATFDASSPATLGEDQRNDCIQQFKASMVAAYDPLPDNDEATNENGDQDISGKARRGTSWADSWADIKNRIETSSTTPEDRKKSEGQRFDELPFISGFLQVLSGPQKDAPIHYPRDPRERKPNPEGENFKWFVDNEKRQGKKVALPAVTDKKGLPYKP